MTQAFRIGLLDLPAFLRRQCAPLLFRRLRVVQIVDPSRAAGELAAVHGLGRIIRVSAAAAGFVLVFELLDENRQLIHHTGLIALHRAVSVQVVHLLDDVFHVVSEKIEWIFLSSGAGGAIEPGDG